MSLLSAGEEHRGVLSTPREDVLVEGAFHAQIAGVLRVVPLGCESDGECRREVLIDEQLHAVWAAGR